MAGDPPDEPQVRDAEIDDRRRRSRRPELDALRVLAGGMFVVWHVLQYVAAERAVPERAAWLALSQFFVLGGPLFFFLSALLCFHRHPAPQRGEWRDYWGRRLLAVAAPFLVWSLVGLAWEAPRLREAGGAGGATALGLGVGHLAFVVALLQFYLLFPLLRRLWGTVERWVLVAAAFLLGTAWTLGGRAYLPAELPPGVAFPLAGCLLGWLPYVALGARAADHVERLELLAPRPVAVWAALLTAGTLVAVWHYALGPGRALGPPPYAGAVRVEVLIAALAWGPILLCLAARARSGVAAGLVREAAPWAPGVFFVHGLPLKAAASVLPDHWPGWAAALMLGTVTVGGTLGLLRLAGRHPLGLLVAGVVRRRRATPRQAAAAEDEVPMRIAAGW